MAACWVGGRAVQWVVQRGASLVAALVAATVVSWVVVSAAMSVVA